MEMLSMGPRRRAGDALQPVADGSDAEPVDLGVQTRPAEPGGESPDQGERDPDPDAPQPGVVDADHWLAGLVRPDVLGVSGAAVLLLIAIGIPFLTAFEAVGLFIGPAEIGPAWTFAPTLVAAGAAVALGLGGLRQAAYHGAAAWVRITSGVAATVGLLLIVGAALVWFLVTQSDPFGPLRP